MTFDQLRGGVIKSVNHTILLSNIVLKNSSTLLLLYVRQLSNCRSTLTVMLSQMYVFCVHYGMFKSDSVRFDISVKRLSDLIFLLDVKEPSEL